MQQPLQTEGKMFTKSVEIAAISTLRITLPKQTVVRLALMYNQITKARTAKTKGKAPREITEFDDLPTTLPSPPIDSH